MHVGYSMMLNGGYGLPDSQVYENEMRLVDLAVDLGFESVWSTEHHFTDYILSPDPLQILTWVAARHPSVQVGTSVIVLPWHDPVRVAEQISLLDTLTEGRLVVGLGRGIGKVEYDGLRIDMNTARDRFKAFTNMLLDAFDTGVIEATSNDFMDQPRRELRPRPIHSLRGRTYAAAGSPDSMPIMAELGIGLLIIVQKAWDLIAEELAVYRTRWTEVHGEDSPPPAPLAAAQLFTHPDAATAKSLAYEYMGNYYKAVIDHYGFNTDDHSKLKGYDNYANIKDFVDTAGADTAAASFVDPLPWGTPDEILEKLRTQVEITGMIGFSPSFYYGGMSIEQAEASMRLFAAEVLPVLQSWETAPIPKPKPSGAVA